MKSPKEGTIIPQAKKYNMVLYTMGILKAWYISLKFYDTSALTPYDSVSLSLSLSIKSEIPIAAIATKSAKNAPKVD